MVPGPESINIRALPTRTRAAQALRFKVFAGELGAVEGRVALGDERRDAEGDARVDGA